MPTLFEQRRRSLIRTADDILCEIDRLLNQPRVARDEDLDDRDLTTAKMHVCELRRRLEVGCLPPRMERLAEMTRLIVDQWPLATKIGSKISALEESYRRI